MALAAARFFAARGAARAQGPAIDGNPLDVYADGIGSLQVQFDNRDRRRVLLRRRARRQRLRAGDERRRVPPGLRRPRAPVRPDVGGAGAVRTATSRIRVTDLHAARARGHRYTDGTRDVRLHYEVTNLSRRAGARSAPASWPTSTWAAPTTARACTPPARRASSAGSTADAPGSGLVEQTPWTHYQQGEYNAIFDDFLDGSLHDTIDPFDEVDNGAGAEWDFANLAPGATVPIDVTWGFEDDTIQVNTRRGLRPRPLRRGRLHACARRCLHAPAGSVVTVPAGEDPRSTRNWASSSAGASLTVVGAGATGGTTVDAGGHSRVLEVGGARASSSRACA